MKKISFDEETGVMRIGGVNCVENAHVSVYYESWDDTE